MTSGNLAIDLGENIKEINSTGIAAGYRTPLTACFYRPWFPRWMRGLKSRSLPSDDPSMKPATARVKIALQLFCDIPMEICD